MFLVKFVDAVTSAFKIFKFNEILSPLNSSETIPDRKLKFSRIVDESQ
jgi:hypothetical protein